jgi:hypothetical protein
MPAERSRSIDSVQIKFIVWVAVRHLSKIGRDAPSTSLAKVRG